MKKIFSWLIAGSIALYILSAVALPFMGLFMLIPVVIGIAIAVAAVSAVGLIIVLVRERIKDRKDEKDDLSKY